MEQTINLFPTELQNKLNAKVALYETRRASILEVLRILMEEQGHITLQDEEKVAQYLGIAPIDVREVMTFYTLFYDKPRAKTRFNVCRTLTCNLLGADEIIKHLEKRLGIQDGETAKDGRCSLKSVECLGACEIAPMMQINDDEFVGNLTKAKIDELIKQVNK